MALSQLVINVPDFVKLETSFTSSAAPETHPDSLTDRGSAAIQTGLDFTISRLCDINIPSQTSALKCSR